MAATLTPAEALTAYGSATSWRTGARVTGIGTTLGAGSWPVWDARGALDRRGLVRNPAFLDESARWQNIPEWAPRRLTGIGFLDWWNGIGEAQKQIGIPWPKGATGPGGTQAQSSDNGVIIDVGDGTWWELQGMAPTGSGAWRVDAAAHVAPGVRIQGSQGPWAKRDGLLTPAHLAGPWTGPVRFVGFNVAYGPGARAVSGARVEHPKVEQIPAAMRAVLPAGDDPRMLRCGQVLRLDITDDGIERWLDAIGVAPSSTLRVSMRWFATGLRDHGMRLSETGTGDPIIEGTGGTNPVERAAWAARGVTTEAQANGLGRNLFTFGRLVAA